MAEATSLIILSPDRVEATRESSQGENPKGTYHTNATFAWFGKVELGGVAEAASLIILPHPHQICMVRVGWSWEAWPRHPASLFYCQFKSKQRESSHYGEHSKGKYHTHTKFAWFGLGGAGRRGRGYTIYSSSDILSFSLRNHRANTRNTLLSFRCTE